MEWFNYGESFVFYEVDFVWILIRNVFGSFVWKYVGLFFYGFGEDFDCSYGVELYEKIKFK